MSRRRGIRRANHGRVNLKSSRFLYASSQFSPEYMLGCHFLHPSGLFDALVLITGPRELRPMSRADLVTIKNTTNLKKEP